MLQNKIVKYEILRIMKTINFRTNNKNASNNPRNFLVTKSPKNESNNNSLNPSFPHIQYLIIFNGFAIRILSASTKYNQNARLTPVSLESHRIIQQTEGRRKISSGKKGRRGKGLLSIFIMELSFGPFQDLIITSQPK